MLCSDFPTGCCNSGSPLPRGRGWAEGRRQGRHEGAGQGGQVKRRELPKQGRLRGHGWIR